MTLLTGTMGIGAIQGVEAMPSPTPTSEIIKIAIQLIIGVITAWKMLKKPKEVISNQNTEI
ncbi:MULTISPECIES: hypothetical protein [unclassified Flavobacterium]|jgi:hypothetical protein|uniref:hypothetical protein n=1 Tax=unclassified Flavobacterium TaxID=196869 RepID=UPI00064AA7D9|nr:hypothetical protein [Flavobacterium sp. ABG]KLT70352.1 hypothetical protein AB674_06665 [Flavobacterium sp. ABG]